jgi:hypothetical protein
MSKWSDAQQTCTRTMCDAAGHAKAADANDTALLSTVAFGVGVAALTTGIVVYLTTPRKPTQAHAQLAPVFGPGVVGISLTGGF